MNDLPNKGLLPAGLSDVLPPEAAQEAAVAEGLVNCLSRHGFERVKPPLIEFEEGLLTGAGAATAGQTFRLMDPVSQHMMGIRSDMTVQVARIAATRLTDVPRPLRLSYGGQVLRVRGTQLRPARQISQVGCELIGSASIAADVEVVLLAVEALEKIGVPEISIDITMPTLVPAVADEMGLDGAAYEKLRAALDRKDAAAVTAIGGEIAETMGLLLEYAGAAGDVMGKLEKVKLPPRARKECDRLLEVVSMIRDVSPELSLTIDPVENRGFEYHSGVSFSIFSRRERSELGWGGRYLAGNGGRGEEGGEPATGFTLFLDSVLRVVPEAPMPRRVFLAFNTSRGDNDRLREEGWVVIQGLEPIKDALAEARRMNCDHAYVDGELKAVD